MSAIRLARAATGRDAVLKFAGAYHGHVDGLLAEAGSGLATQGIPASPGVTAAQAADTVVVPWNDRDGGGARAGASARWPRSLCEPYPANMGLVPPEPTASWRFLREAADAAGALLVFDEVITGLPGGARRRAGARGRHARPDGPGQDHRRRAARPRPTPGRRDLMERIAPAGDVYQAGTLSGNPLATAAGPRDAARCSTTPPTEHLDALAAALAEGLEPRPRRGGRAAPGGAHHRPAHALLLRGAGARLRRRRGVRPRGPRRLLPRHARARRVPAALAVRGVVPVARPRRRGRRAHARRGPRGAAPRWRRR